MGISVLMSVYKKENPKYFKIALDSIVNQTLKPDEIVLIKDGPLTAELEKVIEEVQYPGLRTYQFEENVQLGRALKKGVELCEHEFIARMDTDDVSYPDRLQKQYDYMISHERVAALGGFMEEFCDDDSIIDVKTMPVGAAATRSYARFRNPLNHMTVMFRKEAILEAGNYRHYPFLEDYDLWSRVLAFGYQLDNLPEVLAKARVGKELYGRRGGFGYCKRYLQLRKEQRKLGVTNNLEYLIACAITVAMTILPSGARKQIYQKVLRK